ncbi:protein kinase [Spiractinospora alimapuensis]|uniref:serine/threonine-protein kinase n=1 Tax=Spiractinospora alimapuensis TaxID=2820884 RepID=UPI001F3D5F53|nr:serine/threonine-protein kinase [Spiractinospora alimapuensis]QVQ51893.1 protein kinase [Spiractinospora alimapuensis]
MTSNGSHRVKPLRAGDPEELGEYRIRGRLGRGGMGTVYLATDAQGREVALKLIHPDLSDDEAFRRRFAREVHSAQSVARFSTAAVLDAQLEGETLYIVSEYVAGPNLAEAIDADGPMFSGTLEGLALGVAAALAAIHGAGVVHRDLKPANVLLSSVGPKVIDFGIARALDDDNAVTRSSQLMGTPAYLAPELILGQDITPASDIFSWGCLVAFAGRGTAPFDAPTVPAVLHQISTAEPDLSGFDDTLRAVVGEALSKEPESRPTAQQILDQLVGKDNSGERDVGRTVMRSWTPPTAAAQAATFSTPPEGQAPPPAADGSTAHIQHDPTTAMPDPSRPDWNPAAANSGGYPGQAPTGQPGHGQPHNQGHGQWGHAPSGPQPPHSPANGTQPWNGGSGPQYAQSGAAPRYGAAQAPPTTPGGDGSGGKGGRRLWFALGGGGLALVIVVVAVIVAITSNSGPPEGVVVYNDDFANMETGWGRGDEFDLDDDDAGVGYTDNAFIVRADDDDPRMGASSEYEGDELDEGLMITSTMTAVTTPPQGQMGVYCYRDSDSLESTAYEFLVRGDGAEAQIRKLAGEGGESALVDTQSVSGFDDGENAENTLVATCVETEDGDAMELRFWINDRLVLEGTDNNPPELGENHGIVARRPGGGSGPSTTIAFQDFSLSQLPAEE